MKLLKKAIALVAVVVLTMTALIGCASEAPTIDDNEIVMTIGDKEVTLGMANFYVRYQQSMYESFYTAYMGEHAWAMEMDGSIVYDENTAEGTTYEEDLKADVLESLKELYILEAHMEEYGVTLTEDELAQIDKAAKAFQEANSDDSLDKVSGEYVAEYLRLITISKKMDEAIRATANTEVSEDDAKQKIMYYVAYETTTTSESGEEVKLSKDEIAALKKDAEAFLKGAKENGNLSAYAAEAGVEATQLAFNANSTDIDEKAIKAADALELNGFTDVIVGETAIYVAQVTSLFDQEATDKEKEEIVETRKEELYTTTLEKWTEETEIKVNDEVWAKVSLDGLKVTPIVPETEEEEE